MSDQKSLNGGTKTHPLSSHAIKALFEIKRGSSPASTFNPGVIDRLLRGGHIRLEQRPSPFKSGKGNLINFAVYVGGAP